MSEGDKFGNMSKLAPYPFAYLEAAKLASRITVPRPNYCPYIRSSSRWPTLPEELGIE